MLRPDMVLIGESDARAGNTIEAIYQTICENQPAISRMNLVNAELAKIAVNTFITTKISYANMLAEICDRVAGADVNIVTAALGRDSRIGAKYLRGATGYGGPCFPRDNAAFSSFARSLGARADIAEATDQINRHQLERLVGLIESKLGPRAGPQGRVGGAIGILGLAYKPDTAVIEESQGVALAVRLAALGYRVSIFDPLAIEAAKAVLGDKVVAARSAAECAAEADLLVIATPWPSFSALPAEAMARGGRKLIIIDCWRVLPAACADLAEIVYLGRGAGQGGGHDQLDAKSIVALDAGE
jgi:UDPglucose 6-dehydrogenase